MSVGTWRIEISDRQAREAPLECWRRIRNYLAPLGDIGGYHEWHHDFEKKVCWYLGRGPVEIATGLESIARGEASVDLFDRILPDIPPDDYCALPQVHGL